MIAKKKKKKAKKKNLTPKTSQPSIMGGPKVRTKCVLYSNRKTEHQTQVPT